MSKFVSREEHICNPYLGALCYCHWVLEEEAPKFERFSWITEEILENLAEDRLESEYLDVVYDYPLKVNKNIKGVLTGVYHQPVITLWVSSEDKDDHFYSLSVVFVVDITSDKIYISEKVRDRLELQSESFDLKINGTFVEAYASPEEIREVNIINGNFLVKAGSKLSIDYSLSEVTLEF